MAKDKKKGGVDGKPAPKKGGTSGITKAPGGSGRKLSDRIKIPKEKEASKKSMADKLYNKEEVKREHKKFLDKMKKKFPGKNNFSKKDIQEFRKLEKERDAAKKKAEKTLLGK